MRKRMISAAMLLVCIVALPVLPAAAEDCSARSMIVYEPRTGTVLAEQNADEELLVASTTKIMTALVVLEHCALQETVTATAAQAAVEGSSMYLKAGETYTVEELLYGLILASGNDAAAALAEHTAGSCESFAKLMNDKCAALGLQHSHFANPHGLDAEGHYSSARDLAVITAAAMENPDFCRIFSTRHYTVHGVSYENHNKLLSSCEGCIGGKTGYTKAAGRVLVSCAERNGFRLICVTISDVNDWEDHRSAYDAAFGQYRYVSLPEEHWREIEVNSGCSASVPLCCGVPGVVLPKNVTAVIRTELPRFVFAPILPGQELGRVTVTADGKKLFTAPVYCAAGTELDAAVPLTARERFQRGWDLYCRYGIYRVYPMYY